MNICFGIIAILLCSFIGFRLTAKYTDKKNYYYFFKSFNDSLIKEVSFSQNTLINLLNNISDKDNAFNKVLIDYFENKKIEKINIKFLTEDEMKFLSDYLKICGNSDKENQLEFLNKINDKLSYYYEQSITNELKYKKLYIKLGFLIGLMIFVILL